MSPPYEVMFVAARRSSDAPEAKVKVVSTILSSL
jgi:hypothetical protein